MKLIGRRRNLSQIVDAEFRVRSDPMRHSVTLLSLTFAWTALSGFQSTGIPIFAQAALSGFRLVGCTDFYSFHPLFLPEPFWFAGKPLFLPRYVNLAGLLFMRSIFSLCLHWRGEEGRHHPWWLGSWLLLRTHV